jgi:hypothetical protein
MIRQPHAARADGEKASEKEGPRHEAAVDPAGGLVCAEETDRSVRREAQSQFKAPRMEEAGHVSADMLSKGVSDDDGQRRNLVLPFAQLDELASREDTGI